MLKNKFDFINFLKKPYNQCVTDSLIDGYLITTLMHNQQLWLFDNLSGTIFLFIDIDNVWDPKKSRKDLPDSYWKKQ